MYKVYSVFDTEKKEYSVPFFIAETDNFVIEDDMTHINAIRAFKAQLYDRHNYIGLFPDVFELYMIGTFDESIGDFSEFDKYYLVITGIDALKEEKKKDVQN